MTDTRTVFTAHDVPDLIGSLPTLFGFTPRESLVAIATSGRRNRFGFRLRLDVPAAKHVEQVADLVAAHLETQDGDGAILVAVTERTEVAATLVRAVEDRIGARARLGVWADAERYWTTLEGSPPDGVEYEPTDHHVSVVQAIVAGQEILPDREALVSRYRAVDGPRRQWLQVATASVLAEVVPLIAAAEPGVVGRVGMAQVGPILDRGLAGERLSDTDLVRFSVWVQSVRVRDEVWARMGRSNATDVLRVLLQVVRSVVPPFEPAVLSLAAFAAWLSGDGAQALIAVERALAADPRYSMARSILQTLEAGISPACWPGSDDRGPATDDGEEVTDDPSPE